MSWESYVDSWHVHSRTDAFKRRFDRACGEVMKVQWRGAMFCAMSGGKDSMALASVLHACGQHHTMAHAHTELNTPGMEDCARAASEKLGCKLVVIEPDLSPFDSIWSFLKSFQGNIYDRENFEQVLRRIASGDLLTSFLRSRNYDGVFTGMRADESHGRRMNRRVRGASYRLQSIGTWMCNPISDFTVHDAFAACVSAGLPLCDHYRLTYERLGLRPDGQGSRVDCMLTTEQISAFGSISGMRVLYPNVWSMLVRARPELSQLT